MEYTFVLRVELADQAAIPDELVERLGAEGCNDVLVGIGQPNRIALQFVRVADSAEAALLTAMADVKRALPGVKLIDAAPDFVGLTDVTNVVGEDPHFRSEMAVEDTRIKNGLLELAEAMLRHGVISKLSLAKVRDLASRPSQIKPL